MAKKLASVVVACGVIGALVMAPAAQATDEWNTLVELSPVTLEAKGDSTLRVSGEQGLWGKPIRLEEVHQDQRKVLIKAFTLNRSKPSVIVRNLDPLLTHRVVSKGLRKPIVFRLSLAANDSTAKDADTTRNRPAGDILLDTVEKKGSNTSWYLSPYNYDTVGQSVVLDRAITANEIAWRFSPSVTTLLTPEGVELMKNPAQIDWSDPKSQGIEIFNNDPSYSFPAVATVTIYSDLTDPLAEMIPQTELKERASFTRAVKISHNGYLTFNVGSLRLEAGAYLVTLRLADTPDDVLTVFLEGHNFGGPLSKRDLYPQGQAFRLGELSEGGEPFFAFVKHGAKRQPVSSIGMDIMDPGDLELIFVRK